MSRIRLFLWSSEVDPRELDGLVGGPDLWYRTKAPGAGHSDARPSPAVRTSSRTGPPQTLLNVDAAALRHLAVGNAG